MLFPPPRSPSPLGTWVLPSGPLSHLTVLLPWAQTLSSLPRNQGLHLLALAGGQAPSQPGAVPRLLWHSGQPATSPTPASRRQQAPGHKDSLLAGDPVNMQGPRNWHSAWSGLQLTLGKGTMGDGAPLLLATAGLQPRKENSFSGHICPFVAPPHLHRKTPGTPTAPARRAAGGAGRSSGQNQHQKHKTAIQAATKIPCPDTEAPGIKTRGREFPGPTCFWGAAGVPGQHGQYSPLERWMQVCWLSLRKKPLWH